MSDEDKTMMTPEEVRKLLRVNRATLTAWRAKRGHGPTFIRLGERVIRYRRADVEAYLQAREGAKA